ncbi:MAG: NADH-quinone oxidoreductase subunit NuoH, partial [Armatimonadetes bacterium]|nr:NADH-quinone oxidoreductase subunit NuoH [Armatimonadota bacterium]
MGIADRIRNLFDSAGLPPALDWVKSDIVMMLVVLVLVIGFISVSVLFLIWLERKVSARIQRRMGPMLAGIPWLNAKSMWLGGIFQTAADAIKLLIKEDLTPAEVDKLVYFLAPMLVFTASLMSYVVIPFGDGLSVTDLNVGVVYLLAVSSIAVLAIMMAGWGSNSKYSLLGGLRSVAQMISYEIPMIFALLGPVLMAGSLSMQDIVKAQAASHWFIIPNIIGFIVFIIAGTAETNRPPFDLPEGESELVAGFVTEYSGMKFAMFFLAEFSNLFVVSAVATTLFLGGWAFPGLDAIADPAIRTLVSFLVFLVKTYVIILLLMWIRWTFP